MKSRSSDLSKKKSPSSVKSSTKEVNGTSTTKKSQKNNLNSANSKEDKSRKRKREEEQKKSKSKTTAANQKVKRNKENIVEVKNSNSVKSTTEKPLSSVGGKPSQKSVMGSTSLKSEQGEKKQTENGTDENLKTYSRRSKPGTSVKHPNSVSRREEAGSSRSNGQTKNAVPRKSTRNSQAKSVKIHPSRQDEKKTRPEATRHEPSRPSLEKAKARKLKVLRVLGLAPPVGSPFIKQGASSKPGSS